MIFGKTKEATKAEKQREMLQRIFGIKKFVILPTKLESGQWCALQYVWIYNDGGIREDGAYFLWYPSTESCSPTSRAYLDQDDSHVSLNRLVGSRWEQVPLNEVKGLL